jgi:transcriptional regulator with XRE-family HTH domain
MGGAEFARMRASLGKSQRELAGLLGLSLKAVESYEQGWRRVPAHVERVLYFLLFKLNEDEIEAEDPCWQSQGCADDQRENCVAFLAKAGSYCWFFTGRLCASARASGSGSAKDGAPGEKGCYTCSVFTKMLDRIDGGRR